MSNEQPTRIEAAVARQERIVGFHDAIEAHQGRAAHLEHSYWLRRCFAHELSEYFDRRATEALQDAHRAGEASLEAAGGLQ